MKNVKTSWTTLLILESKTNSSGSCMVLERDGKYKNPVQISDDTEVQRKILPTIL